MRYTWKAAHHWSNYLVAAGPVGFCLILLLGMGPHRLPTISDFSIMLGYSLPLVAALLTVSLPTVEFEQGVSEHYLSYPQPPAVRLLLYGAGSWVLWVLSAVLTIAFASLAVSPAAVLALAASALVPAVALSGAAAACSALTRHRAGGLFAAILWWAMDAVAPGTSSRYVYLFAYCRPVPGVAPEVQTRNLLVIGFLLWGVTAWLVARRERWVR